MPAGKRAEIVRKQVNEEWIDMKACAKCGELKILTDYQRHSSCVGGRNSVCRACRVDPNARRMKPRVMWTDRLYKEHVARDTHGEYSVLGTYSKAIVKIAHKHNTCGNIYEVRPDAFLRGVRCPRCYGSIKRDTESFKKAVEEVAGDEYKVVGKYTRSIDRVDMLHNTCGNTYAVRPDAFMRGVRCPHCVESRGERKVRDFLNKRRYLFTREYRFADCRDKKELPFDFAVHLGGGDLLLIEYDGEHHFRPVSYGDDVRAARDFKRRQRRDRIKTDFCTARGIPLIRIPYTDYDRIDEILDDALAQTVTELIPAC